MKYNIHETCQIDHDILQNIYLKYFGYKENGTFVEVGAFDGITFGHTSGLAEAGWKGLYIEADKNNAETCMDNHKDKPNIIVENCAIGNNEGICKLYVGGAVSSTIYGEVAKDWGLLENVSIDVNMYKLDTILVKHNWPENFDLLVVDVEEAELQVLEGFNISLYKPKMAIIETHEKELNTKFNWKAKPIAGYFNNNGYEKIHADTINSIFVLKESK